MSCSTQLISCLDKWTQELDQCHSVDTVYVYLDFSNAFDSVPHKRLLVKMANYGIIGKTFLVRSQAKSGDKLREVSMEKVISGVPQGSVIYIGLIPYVRAFHKATCLKLSQAVS